MKGRKGLFSRLTKLPNRVVTLGYILAAWLQPSALAKESINIYTSRHYQVDEKVHRQFTEQTGIEINQLFVKNAAQLLERARIEGKSSTADVLILTDVGNLHRAKKAGLFQPLKSQVAQETIPQTFRDEDDEWVALSRRARILVYNKEKVKPEEMSTYEDLTTEKWRGRLLVRSSTNVYNQSLTAAMIAALGKGAVEKWAAGITKNLARKPEGGDTDQIRAVARGIGDIAIVNSYYYARLAASTSPEDQAVVAKVKPFFPNQSNRGTHINISGAGIMKHAPQPARARKFIEFLLSSEVQAMYAQENFEFAARPDVKPAPEVLAFGSPLFDKTPLSRVAEQTPTALDVLDRAGWR